MLSWKIIFQKQKRVIVEMPDIIAGSLNGKFPDVNNSGLEVVSVLLNYSCNLKCLHCYLSGVRMKRKGLTREQWLKVFESAFLYGVKTLAFSGKEIFFDRRTAGIFFEAIRLRDDIQVKRETQIGVITNGTMIGAYRDELLSFEPDYIDISVDGLPEVHDFIRGEKSFEKLSDNLKWLSFNFPDRVWIIHTIFDQNVNQLKDFLIYFSEGYGITRFSLGFYKSLDNTSDLVSLSEGTLERFINDIIFEIAEVRSSKKILISLDVDFSQPYLIKLLVDRGWVDIGERSSTHRIKGRDVEIVIHGVFVPLGLWKAVRITPEGYWLATDDILKVADYEKFAVANVEDFNFDIGSIYLSGLSSQRFKELFREHISLNDLLGTDKNKITGDKDHEADFKMGSGYCSFDGGSDVFSRLQEAEGGGGHACRST